MLNFKPFISEALHPILNPKTKKPYRAEQKVEQIKRFVKFCKIPMDDLWITYSDYPQLTIKPVTRTSKSTPQGIFGYPMRYYLDKNGDMPYATERNFILIFKVLA